MKVKIKTDNNNNEKIKDVNDTRISNNRLIYINIEVF